MSELPVKAENCAIAFVVGAEAIVEHIQESAGEDIESSLDKLLDFARRHAVNGQFEDDVCLFAMDVGSGL